jgi:hypothetical protein
MGYQESFLWNEDFEGLLEKVRGLGKTHFDERYVNVVEIVTLNEDLKFDLDQMMQPETVVDLPAGTKMLWITGDRSYQRRVDGTRGLLGNDDLEDESWIFFVECFSDQLFGENGEYLFTVEKFKW